MRGISTLCLMALLMGAAVTEIAAAPAQVRDWNKVEIRKPVDWCVRGGLPNFNKKLRAGEPVRIAYFGGSITAQNGWRPQSLEYFRSLSPSGKADEIHAAIGGTGKRADKLYCAGNSATIPERGRSEKASRSRISAIAVKLSRPE